MNRWIELRTAYKVAMLGTISAAADDLGVHRATVNRHIDSLEADLGKKLFQRHSRGYVLTDTGKEFFRVAHKANEMFADFAGRTRAGAAEVSGEIIVSVHSALAGLMMRPIITFRDTHPKIHVKLIPQDSLVKLEYAEAHVSLFGGEKPDHPDYVIQPFAGFRVGLYAHKDYVARNGLPASPEEFKDHDFATHPGATDRLPFEAWFARNVPQDRIVLTASHPRVVHEAIMGGVVIGFLPEEYASRCANLHEVIAPRDRWTGQIWIVTHVDLHKTEKVKAMIRCIKESRPRRSRPRKSEQSTG